jgi:uncharacterized protein (DUF2384 family)
MKSSPLDDLLTEIFQKGIEWKGSYKRFENWLKSPNENLQNKTPQELLDTENNAWTVWDEIEEGLKKP